MRYIAAILYTVTALGAMAAESTDTVIAVSGAKSVTIIDTPTQGVTVVINKGADTVSVDCPYPADGRIVKNQTATTGGLPTVNACAVACNPNGWTTNVVVSDIDLGFLNATGTPDGLDIDQTHSFEIGVTNLLGVRFSSPLSHRWRNHFTVGFGIDWRIYSLRRGQAWMSDDAGNLLVSAYPEGAYPKKSRLNTFSLELPLMYTLELPCRWWGIHPSITVGAIGCWNTSATATTRWETPEHNELSRHTEGLHQRRFTIDLTARVRFCPIASVYARYSPCSVFDTTHGPKMHPLSIGISLF